MKFYNTLTRQVEELVSLDKDSVKIYNCGLTVYSHPHIGNWVGYIYWDVLHRALENVGYKVNRVQNITDVGHLVSDDDDGEDKMEKSALSEGKTAWEIAEKYIKIANFEAYELLGLKKPKLIRATDKIKEQIEFVKKLEELSYTYEIKDEGIYFDTSKLDDYGKLAKLDKEGLKEGARVSVDGKKNATDFAIWKFSPTDKKRDMEWDSPWGKGFPGWHLECSVIAYEELGEQIDIHTGGIDHIPVHHTNEIAQTETITGKTFAQCWLHNNHMKVNGTKMSKSLGNIYRLKDITDKGFDLQAFKVLVLSKHYQTEGNFTWEILESSQNRLDNWQLVADLRWQIDKDDKSIEHKNYNNDIMEALLDNLDTPKALTVIDKYFDHLLKINKAPSDLALDYLKDVLGIDLYKPDITKKQKQIIQNRDIAKDSKNYADADEFRNELASSGIALRDTENGTYWYRAKK